MARAALEDVARLPVESHPWNEGPCGPDEKGLWYGSAKVRSVIAEKLNPSWRGCLQKLTAGDFLSPVFVGIAIRDLTSVPRWFHETQPWWQDRAVLLERAWEQRYRQLITRNPKIKDVRHPRGLQRPFGYLIATFGRSWIPLLFLNGSSVESGRRIMVADVKPWECAVYPDGALGVQSYLQEGYDLFEILGSGARAPHRLDKPCEAPRLASVDPSAPSSLMTAADQASDVALSTAATMSARFPIISPAGVLRNQDGNAVDRIIDGGFFENDGLATAADIARVLIRHELRPVILHVTNEPIQGKRRPVPQPSERADETAGGKGTSDDSWRDPRPEPSPTLPDAKEIAWIQSFTTPIKGLYRTRSGHGAEANSVAVRVVEEHAYETLCMKQPRNEGKDLPCPAHYIHVAVYDELPGETGKDIKVSQVSMSWWLSQPVQAYLNAQLRHPLNRCSLDILTWHLTAAPRQHGDAVAFTSPESCIAANKLFGS